MTTSTKKLLVIERPTQSKLYAMRALFSRSSKDNSGKKIPLIKRSVIDLFFAFISVLHEHTELSVEEIGAIFDSLSEIKDLPKKIPSDTVAPFIRDVLGAQSLNEDEIAKKLNGFKYLIYEERFVLAALSFGNEKAILALLENKKKKDFVTLLRCYVLIQIAALQHT